MMNTTNNTNGAIDNNASVNKLTNVQRWNLLITKCTELAQRGSEVNKIDLGITVQEKKKKICVRVYADETRTKFYNYCEIIFKSRYGSYEIFAREENFIPNALKENKYSFHDDYDMKHESVISENDFHSLGLLFTAIASKARTDRQNKAQ